MRINFKKFKKLKKFIKKEKKSEDIDFFYVSDDDSDDESKKKKSRKKKKRTNIFQNFHRRNTLQIVKYLETKNIFNCFFYTDVQNIPLILEQGIKPIGQIKLMPKEEYIVWTYLEHATYLELELGNSTRHYFWKWCTEQKVDLNNIAIISVDISKLFQVTKQDWELNLETNRIQIYEQISNSAIDWILVKNQKMFRLAKIHAERQNLKLKIFQGNEGQIIT
ncbi:MAG: acetyltransferase [Spiroplasma sp.]